MPEETKITPKSDEKWVTIGGKKVQIDPDKDAEEQIREKLPSVGGAKQSETKEARKGFDETRNLIKTPFKIRDEVVFDNYQKSGILYGLEGDYVRIFSKNSHYTRLSNDVFLKSELLNKRHWDTMIKDDRLELLEKSQITKNYVKYDWSRLPELSRKIIMKNLGPAGYEGGVSTSTPGVWNPVNDDKTVNDRIKESKTKEVKEDTKDKKDEG